MKEQPLVSVIIPVYNVEKYLAECIDSVLCQTYKNLEIILVDDGSTDSSGEICDKYALNHSNIKVIHKENGGQSTARNLGFEDAVGKYIYFIDSDDIMLPSALKKLVSVAEDTCADVVFFDAESFADEGYGKKIRQTYLRKGRYKTQAGIITLSEMHQNKEYHCVVWGMLLSRQHLIENNIEFISGVYYEDMAYTYEVLCLAKTVAQCTEVLYKHRFRPDSTMTSRKSKKYFNSSVVVYNSVRDFSADIDILHTDIAKKYVARLAYNVLNNYYKLKIKDKKDCRRELKEVKKDILCHNSFDDKALKCKCYSRCLWVAYKIYDKTLGKL